MIFAAFVAAGAVAVGAALGLAGERAERGVSLARTFAIAAGLATIASALLPAALGEAGLIALVAFAAGVVVPRLFSHGAHGREEVGLEVGFIGLLGHQVGDGLALGTYGGHAHEGHDHTNVLLAISAHTVPLAALVVLSFVKRRGVKPALARAAALAGATLVGIALTGLVPLEWVERYEPYVAACVAGLLFHVVTHGALTPNVFPRTLPAKVAELVALCAGASLTLLGDSHHAGHADWKARIATALGEVAMGAAPGLAIGLVCAVLLARYGQRFSNVRPTGVVSGVRLALFRSRAVDVLDSARDLRDQGAPPSAVVAYVFSALLLGLETLAIVAWLFGPLYALAYATSALALGCGTALVAAKALGKTSSAGVPTLRPRALRTELEGVLSVTGPFIVLGLLLAGYLSALVPVGALDLHAYPGVAVLLASAIAILAHVRPPLAPLACAVLVAKGLSPGAALAALVASAALHPSITRWLMRTYGARGILPTAGLFLLATWSIALGVDAAGLTWTPNTHEGGLFAVIALATLGGMLVYGVFQSGLSAWVSTIASAYLDASHKAEPPCGTEETFGPAPMKRDSDLSRCV